MTKIHLQSTYSDIVSDGGLDPRNEYEKKFKQMPLTLEEVRALDLERDCCMEDIRKIERAHGIGVEDE
jgi:hypothetical protein